MRIILQRVSRASVHINGKEHAAIGQGYLILLGIASEDTQEDIDWLARKIIGLRLFSEEDGAMNKSICEVDGEVMVVSQFTLYASTKKGNRPSFLKAAKPAQAILLYEKFNDTLAKFLDKPVKTGIFGADMHVALINNGPVTIMMDSKNRE